MVATRLRIVAWLLRLLPVPLALVAWRLMVPSLAEAPSGTPLHLLARLGRERPAELLGVSLLGFLGLGEYWRRRLVPSGSVEAEPRASAARRGLATSWASTLVAMALATTAAVALHRVAGVAAVDSTSMVPTLLPSDRLWVDKRARPLRRGDVVVFHHRGDGEPGELVKRVVGLPGDHVSITDGVPALGGRPLRSCDAGSIMYIGATHSSRGRLVVEWLDERPYLTIHEPGPQPPLAYDVKPGELVVLGDNRGVSNDSRSWPGGPGLPLADVDGRVERVVFGADRTGRLDPERWWRSLGTELHVPGVDVTALREGVARCLAASGTQR